ncbi:MAG: pro-sigmaK processing inhibitor BofA family protein [Clostridia bacterium]|nr:pro-sigmaK processing inhibitor BofA family protein [Clostridia bacterium]
MEILNLLNQNLTVIIGFCAGIFVLYIVLKALSKPIKLILKFLLNTLSGAICLYLLNFFGSAVGFTININVITAFVVGFLGLPGLLVLIILRFFAII